MGKYKPYIFLGAAVIVALITSLLVYRSLPKGQEKDPSLETQPVAVAAANLTWGTALTKEMLKMVPFNKKSLPEGCFSDPKALEGRVLIFPVNANEPIFESRLAPLNIITGGVAAIITPNKRAIAVKVDKTVGVSGFIHPGNRVDVLVTLSNQNTRTPITKTVLQNILVRTVGPDVGEKNGEEKQSNVDVITLEVTPEEAEKLALASTQGKIQLTLRNYNDAADVRTAGTTIPTLLASYGAAAQTAPKPTPAKKTTVKKATGIKTPASGDSSPKPYVTVGKGEENPVSVGTPQGKSGEITVELITGTKINKLKFEGEE